jgi:hypothetical protein
MPRRKKLGPIRFTKFAKEQQDALPLLLQLPGMKGIFDEVARDGYKDEGRGLIVWLSVDGTFADLKPPVYISAADWRANPLLINTRHPDLLQVLITYDPQAAYILLIVSSGHAGSQVGRYMWWVESFTPRPTPIDVTRN